MEQNEEKLQNALIGVCGLFCGACDNYLAFTEGKENLLKNEKFSNPEDEYCEGCNSSKVSKHCRDCEMRMCAGKKEIKNFGECSEYPCEKISAFKREGTKWNSVAHRNDIYCNIDKYLEIGSDKWLVYQSKKWTCLCGNKYSFYEKKCYKCGLPLISYAKEK